MILCESQDTPLCSVMVSVWFYLGVIASADTLVGLYGFDVRGPSAFPILQQHYWSNVLNVLRRKIGAEVLVTGVPRCVMFSLVQKPCQSRLSVLARCRLARRILTSS